MDIIVETVHGEARVSSREISARLGNAHKNVISLIRDYQEEFALHGRVAFETRPFETAGGAQTVTVCLLNEDQCYFLLTLVRNSETTVPLKSALVQAFGRARRALVPAAPPTPAQQALLAAQALVDLERRTQTLELQLSDVRQELDHSPIRGAELRAVYDLGQRLGQLMGNYRQAWRLFKDRFQLASYRDLPRCQHGEALHFLQTQIESWQDAPLLKGQA